MATSNHHKSSPSSRKTKRRSTTPYETSSTCSSRTSCRSASTASTSTPTSTHMNSPALTPATTLSSLSADEVADGESPVDEATNEGAQTPAPEDELLEDLQTLKERSLTREIYSPEGVCSGHLSTEHCHSVRLLLLKLGDYIPEPKGKRPPEAKEECTKMIKTHMIRYGHKWRCTFCGKAFKKQLGRYDFTKHIRTHLCSAHRPYHCFFEGCKYTDTQLPNMKSHLMKHTGERIICEKCGVEDIKNRVDLFRHRASHHPKKKDSAPEAQAIDWPLAEHSDDGLVQCDLVNAITAHSWSWGMLRSTYDFGETVGSLSRVPRSTCVYLSQVPRYT